MDDIDREWEEVDLRQLVDDYEAADQAEFAALDDLDD